MQMRLFLGTTNTKLTPQIELQRCSVYAVSNRVNSEVVNYATDCLLYTSPSPRDMRRSRMPSSA